MCMKCCFLLKCSQILVTLDRELTVCATDLPLQYFGQLTAMNKLTVSLIVAVVIVMCIPEVHTKWKDCYATWSRCSRWSSPLTGILWKTCNARCRQLKRNGGNCVRTRSKCPMSRKPYQCQCY
uniref:Uncharacterized protein n=1 Tax=Arion vulgaris TaxID=1028688 RepID=A0A0B6ZCE1_9EUPU